MAPPSSVTKVRQQEWAARDAATSIELGLRQISVFLTEFGNTLFDRNAKHALKTLEGTLNQMDQRMALLEAKAAPFLANGGEMGSQNLGSQGLTPDTPAPPEPPSGPPAAAAPSDAV
ncbi:hypothetical protein CXG81DRAFT_20058 [Caulochytrium protostelioides]|uniref:Uncharacterized protein n=1 Tax=Caulochytrium protostelioides TaxID=1555241 RepID=A0A4P9X4E9_9FUNG|nr:hypothetical protein CXG81DRAFT_20058 [Caulochytrium protostelioides]|eukprot:RKO99924.1 hypothetical protein CXG81DRAFT_20058 [Caulochytrium protostelioides]